MNFPTSELATPSAKPTILELIKQKLWSTRKRKVMTIFFTIWTLLIITALAYILLNTNKTTTDNGNIVSSPVSFPEETPITMPVSTSVAEIPVNIPTHMPISDMTLSKTCIAENQNFKVNVPNSMNCEKIGSSNDLAVRGDGIAIEFPKDTTPRDCGVECQRGSFYNSDKVQSETNVGNNTYLIKGAITVEKLINNYTTFVIAFYEPQKSTIYDDERQLITKILENIVSAQKTKIITFSLNNSQRLGNIPNADFTVTAAYEYEKTFTSPGEQTLNIRNTYDPHTAFLFDIGWQDNTNYKYDFATSIGTNSQLGEIYKVRAGNGIYYMKKEDIKFDGGCDGGSIQSPCGPLSLGDYAYYITAAEDTHLTDAIMLSLSYVNK